MTADDPAAPDPGEVLGFGDPAWSGPARRLAAGTGRPFRWFADAAEALAAVTPAGGPLTVSAEPRRLTADVLAALTAAASAPAPAGLPGSYAPGRPLSLLTARTLPILDRVVDNHLRRRAVAAAGIGWVSTEPETLAPADDELSIVPADDASAERMAALGRVDLLMLWGHSREDLFHLGKDALCGASADPPAPGGARLPGCVIDGSCIKDGTVLPIRSLAAGAVVIGGCNVLRMPDTSVFEPEFSLAFSALEGGATAVVASPGMRLGHPAEMLLLYRLLRSGLPLGEAVRRLNLALPHYGIDPPDYLLLGEGDVRFAAGTGPAAGPDPLARDDGTFTAALEDVDADVVAVALPDGAGPLYPGVDEATPAARDLYAAVVAEPTGAQLYLFGRRRLRFDRLVLRLDPVPPAADERASVLAALANYEVYGRLLRGYQPKLRNQVQELGSLATYLGRGAPTVRYDLTAGRGLVDKGRQATELVSRMDRALAEHYLNRTAVRAFVWHDQCLREDGTFTVAGHGTADPCPYCGARVVTRLIRAGLAVPAERQVGTCDTCGTIWDRPSGGGVAVLLGPASIPRGVPARLGLRLTNRLGRPVRGWSGLRLRASQRHGTRVSPEVSEVRLAPHGSVTAWFELVAGASTPAHPEVIRAFFVSELDVSVAQRPVWVRPAQA